MGRVFIKDCISSDLVEDVFTISGKQFAAASNGSNYIKASISDRTGQINARMWKAGRDLCSLMHRAGRPGAGRLRQPALVLRWRRADLPNQV